MASEKETSSLKIACMGEWREASLQVGAGWASPTSPCATSRATASTSRWALTPHPSPLTPHQEFVYDPTIADSYIKTVTLGDVETTLEVLDTAGQDQYREMLAVYYRDADCFLFVYSIIDR